MVTKQQHKKRQTILSDAHNDFQKGLNAYALFKINDKAVSEDLVQDAFMKTWKYLVKGGKIDVMKAFLYHILNNLIVDEYRKRKTVSLDNLFEKGFEPRDDFPERLITALDGKAALLLIQYLPVRYQKVMHMRYIQDLTLKEMSLITGQSINTTSVQIHRGIEKLRHLYNKPVQEDGIV